MVSELDYSSSIKCVIVSKGKVYSIPQGSFSSSSRNYEDDDRYECPCFIDLVEFDGRLNIKEFLDWLVEVGRFFEYRNITEGKQVKFVASKLKGSARA